MDIADGRTGRAGEDYEVKLAIALLPGEAGQVQHRLRGADRVLDFCRAGLLPFKVPAGRDQAAAVLHRDAEHGLFRCRLRAGIDNQSLAVKAREAPEHGGQFAVARDNWRHVAGEHFAAVDRRLGG